ncbi:SH3 domain-containing protein [Streptomyces marincola]|uniref:SH3 domain-containing protein n=1 Tax=Streptomyces marincola TaxID=2878388 RepID=A0A1W7CSH0_9ACTN|nr:hypothetical protein [Streptomyces marincola]ARQ67672.1 hypothetical protein CAG99_01460 [Streptomyces marincola]
MKIRHTVAVAALGAALATCLTAGPAAADRSNPGPDNGVRVTSTDTGSAEVDALALPGRFYVDGARIRSAPHLDAAVRGLGYRSHSVTVHCGTRGPLETYWFRITNNTTGVSGYIEQSVGGPSRDPGGC